MSQNTHQGRFASTVCNNYLEKHLYVLGYWSTGCQAMRDSAEVEISEDQLKMRTQHSPETWAIEGTAPNTFSSLKVDVPEFVPGQIYFNQQTGQFLGKSALQILLIVITPVFVCVCVCARVCVCGVCACVRACVYQVCVNVCS